MSLQNYKRSEEYSSILIFSSLKEVKVRMVVKPYLSSHSIIVGEVKNYNSTNTIFEWSQHHNRVVTIPYWRCNSRTVFYSAVVNRTVVVELVLSWRRRGW